MLMSEAISRRIERKTRQRAANRTSILEAAKRVALREGTGALSLRAVAAEAGYAPASVYDVSVSATVTTSSNGSSQATGFSRALRFATSAGAALWAQSAPIWAPKCASAPGPAQPQYTLYFADAKVPVPAASNGVLSALLYVTAAPPIYNDPWNVTKLFSGFKLYVNNSLVGEAIINAQQAAEKYPELTTMLWDGAGTLPNLWVASLHGVMSQTQQAFYKNLPQFPYDENTVTYVKSALNTNPTLNLVVLWFRGVSGPVVEPLHTQYPTRVVTEKVPMRSSPLCLECSL
jgi:hypothetical protein